MGKNDGLKEISVVVLASIILAIAATWKEYAVSGSLQGNPIFYTTTLIFLIIFTVNIVVKKIVGYVFQTDVKTKFWSWYQYGFRTDWHFKKPLPMLWVPLLITLISKGSFLWLGILEFDVDAKTERVSKRHGLYRFSQVTEHHMAWIAIWGLIANFVFAIAGYIAGFEYFTKLSIFFIAWSVIPLSSLDGSKILFGGRVKWAIYATIAMISLVWALSVL